MRGGWGTMPSSGRSRREILTYGVGVLGALCIPGTAWGARSSARSLTLYSVHTGEEVTAEYAVGDTYDPDALAAFARVLRDFRTGETHPIDPTVLDIVHAVGRMVGGGDAFHVVSGYRSPETNEWKRRQRRHSGVAKDSLHMYGRALDVFLPRRELAQLRRAALTLEAGGVGYYPRSGFVHLDSGTFRTW